MKYLIEGNAHSDECTCGEHLVDYTEANVRPIILVESAESPTEALEMYNDSIGGGMMQDFDYVVTELLSGEADTFSIETTFRQKVKAV